MASTFTDIGTELMTTGENAGTWGTKTNTNIQILEEAVNGVVSQAVNKWWHCNSKLIQMEQ